jgi:hypothetical protein
MVALQLPCVASLLQTGAEDKLAHRLIAREISADQPGILEYGIHRTGSGREVGRARDPDRTASLQVCHK